MTDLLRRAFGEAAKLQVPEQEAFARWLPDELESERRWDDRFARSAESLTKLAAQAVAEHRAGRSLPLDPDTM